MLDGPHQRLGECADDAGSTDIDRLLWKFAAGNALAQQALEHIAEVATAQDARGFDVRIGRFGDERICQIRPLQRAPRSDEHTSELQSLMRITYAVFCLTNNTNNY